MAKYPRVQLVITCQTCDEKITFSIYYGKTVIWNDRDGPKMAKWREHVDAGHEVTVTHTFFPGWIEDESELDHYGAW